MERNHMLVMVGTGLVVLVLSIMFTDSFTDTRTSSEKAADKIMEDSEPSKPEQICIQDNEYVVSSDCLR